MSSYGEPGCYASDVPVRISEKYRPPRKIKLPPSCPHNLDAEIVSEEYDTTMETAAISWIEDYNQRKGLELARRKQKIVEFRSRKEEEKAIREEEEKRKKEEMEEQMRLQKLEEERVRKEMEEKMRQQKLEEEKQEIERERLEFERMQKEKEERDKQEVERLEREKREREEEERVSQLRMEEINIARLRKGGGDVVLDLSGVTQIQMENYNENTETLKEMEELKSEFSDIKLINNSSIQEHDIVAPINSSVESAMSTQQTDLTSSNNLQKPPKKIEKIGNLSSLDISDFEAQNDPFDKAALQSINDMEELALVLQPTVVSSVQPFQQPNQSTNYFMTNFKSDYSSSYIPSQQPYVAVSTSNPNYPPYSYHQSNNWGSSTTSSSMSSKLPQYTPYNYGVPPTTTSYQVPQLSTYAPMSTNVPPSSTNYYATSSTYNPIASTSTTAPSQRPDLEDFYSKYYGGGGQLKNSKSVPDLTAMEDSEVSKISDRIAALTSSDKRPNSTGPSCFVSSNSRPNSNGPVSNSRPPSAGLTQSRPTSGCIAANSLDSSPLSFSTTVLDDPFDVLDAEAQAVVTSVAEMGFPRDRVARAVMRLGTQHKKLIEVLLELQGLEESGEDAVRAELAFYANLGDTEKTKLYLSNARQLVSFGFEESEVVRLLTKHDNDRDKVLEELIA